MSNYKIEKINKWLIVILILLQPITNIIRTMFINDIQLFGLSLFEMFNILLVLISFVLTIYLYQEKKQFFKYFIFIALFFIYSVFHYINILNFDSTVYENYNPNFFSEIYYLFRTFVISLILILNIYYSNIKKQTIIKLVEVLSLIISSVIVFSNIFKIGLLSYGEGMSTLNIFDWFTFKSESAYSYYLITCKGWFSSANQISSILFMTLPIILYLAYRKKCIFNYVVLILHTLAMFMLGTKTANLGVVLIYLFFIIFYFILRILKKTNHSIFDIGIIFFSFCLLFFYSPCYHNISNNLNQQSTFEKIDEENDSNEIIDLNVKENYKIYKTIKTYDCSNLNKSEQKNIIKFYKESSSYLGISNYIIQNYKIENHIEFWCDYIVDYSFIDYRNLKTDILSNIYKENNNKMDKFFGLGYSLNYIYTESDYLYQYYIYGIFGILFFIAPYFLSIIYVGILILKNFKTKFNLENCMYLLGPMLSLIIAYYSGHVLERTFPLLVMSLLVGLNLVNIKKEKQAKEKIMFMSKDNKNLKQFIKFKAIFNNFDYRIVTEKTNNTKALVKKQGRKIEYYIYNNSKRFVQNVLYEIYNILKSLIIYIKFNPNTIVVETTKFVKPMIYIGKIFGSKIILVKSSKVINELKENEFDNQYVLELENFNNVTDKIEDNIINIANSPKKVKKNNYIMKFTIYTFCLFFLIFLFSPLTGDDWGNYINGYGKNLIESILYAKKCFFDYEGRFFSRVLLIYLTPKKLLCSFISACFVSGIYWLSTKLFNNKTNKIIYPLILISMLLIDVEAFNQCYQWIAGRVTYLFPILFVFVILYLNRNYEFKINNFKFILLIILTLIFSMFVETVSCGIIITYLGLNILYIYKNKQTNWKLLILMFISIIGTLLMRYSPGTLNRLNDYSTFDNLSILGKILYNLSNLIKYTLINNSFILILLSIICIIFINKTIKNKFLKIILSIYSSIVPILTGFVYYLDKFGISILKPLLNYNNKIIIIYWISFSIIALIFIFKYLFKQKNYLMTILFISSIGSNFCMLISPIWGGRTSLFTDLGVSIVLIYILVENINFKKLKNCYKLTITLLMILSILFIYGYYNLYKDNIKREKIINQQLNLSDSDCIDIYKLSERFAWNPNPYGKGYLYNTIKLYYQIPKEYDLNLLER